MTYLLDANVLIALSVAEHEHHDRASDWVASVDAVAVCPIVEGALIRFVVRLGESVATARAILDGLRQVPSCEFWPDAISFADVDLGHVVGHRQVTDAYLVGLAISRQARLATLDAALTQTMPEGTILVLR